MMSKEMRFHLQCPWCSTGETLADGKAEVILSVRCCKCGNTYLADLDTMKTEKTKPLRRNGRR